MDPLSILGLALLGLAALLLRVGHALLATGLVRSKNSAAAVLRCLCDFCAATLAFWAVGAAILYKVDAPLFGVEPRLLFGYAGAGNGMLAFLAPTLIATGSVAGTLSERSRFFAVCVVSLLLGGLVIPVAAHWVFYGWLRNLGFIDVAGASWLHVAAGACAAAAALVAGPRTGKYNRDGSTNMIPGHNIPLAAVGATLILAAWAPYVAGASSGLQALDAIPAATNAFLAGAAGGAAGVLFGRLRYGKADIILAIFGLLGGLVSITAAAGLVSSAAAVVIGAVGGVLVPFFATWIDLRGRVDDPTGGIAILTVGGVWGTMAAALFHYGSAAERMRRVGIQILGVAAILALSAVLSVVVFGFVKRIGLLRAAEADEFDGLDLAEHDIGAYPDFQQTTIKSYHLREA